MTSGRNPRVFIGSSKESLSVARGLRANLDFDATVAVWDEALFETGRTTLENLVRFLDEYDLAIFVLSGDDQLISRDEKYRSPRDNVVLEAGMFYGALGRDRVAFLVPRETTGQSPIKLPSDLFGIQLLTRYDEQLDDKNWKQSTGAAAEDIRRLLESRGRRPSESDSSPELRRLRAQVLSLTTHKVPFSEERTYEYVVGETSPDDYATFEYSTRATKERPLLWRRLAFTTTQRGFTPSETVLKASVNGIGVDGNIISEGPEAIEYLCTFRPPIGASSRKWGIGYSWPGLWDTLRTEGRDEGWVAISHADKCRRLRILVRFPPSFVNRPTRFKDRHPSVGGTAFKTLDDGSAVLRWTVINPRSGTYAYSLETEDNKPAAFLARE